MTHTQTINPPDRDRLPPGGSHQSDTPARTRRQASDDRHHRNAPPTERAASMPLVVDTDVGYDPDDAVALTIAALHVPAGLPVFGHLTDDQS